MPPAVGIALALAAVVIAAGGCGQRTLLLVDACRDGGGGFSSCPPASSLRMDLVGLWHLDERAGTVVADSSGEGNDGMLVDLDATAWVTGQVGGALETNAKGYVLINPSPSIDSITFQVSAAAWIYFYSHETVVDYATAISRETGTTLNQHYHLSLNSQEQPAAFANTTIPVHAMKMITPMTWTHLCVTYDGAQVVLYVDGQVVDSMPATGAIPADTTPLILGGNGNGFSGNGTSKISELFPGRIDEVVLYSRALTASEVGQLAAGVQF